MMRQEAGRCPEITLLWVTCCLQLQNDSRNGGWQERLSNFLGRFIHGTRDEDTLSFRLLRRLMKVRLRSWDQEGWRIVWGPSEHKVCSNRVGEAGGLQWPQKPDK